MKRRDVLKTASAAALAALAGRDVKIAAADAQATVPASDRIRVGVIGVGGFGLGTNLPEFVKNPDVEIAAICDVNDASVSQAVALTGGNAQRFRDYRRLLDLTRHRRRRHHHAGALARDHVHRCVRRRQGRLRREAVRASHPRRTFDGRSRAPQQAHRAGRHAATLGRAFSTRRADTCRKAASATSTTPSAGTTRRWRRRHHR